VETACGDPTDNVCNNPDHCSGTDGSCVNEVEPATTPCGDGEGECTNADFCNPATGLCQDNGYKSVETACGDPTDNVCNNPDHCSGTDGSCVNEVEPIDVVCRESAGECDVPETCDGDGSCPEDVLELSTTECHPSTDEDVCDPPEYCTGLSAFCPDDEFTEDGGPCIDVDDNPCTGDDVGIDSCLGGQCVPGDFNVEECGICRTAGFWGQRGGTKMVRGQVGGFNYTQAIINAIDATADDCLQVCGESICGTDNISKPGVLGTLGSALEALCVLSDDASQLNQTYRQTVTAALNCVLSGAHATPEGCAGLFNQVLKGIDPDGNHWEACNNNCASLTPDDTVLTMCLNQLDCWNNGYQVNELGECVGRCQVDTEVVCHADYDCDLTNPLNVCGPPPGNCHEQGLCASQNADVIFELTHNNPFLSCEPDQSEALGAAGGVAACKSAQAANECTISNDRLPDQPDPPYCAPRPVSCPETCE
jgi:hypothetical protein